MVWYVLSTADVLYSLLTVCVFYFGVVGHWVQGMRVSFAVIANDDGALFPLKPQEARINLPLDSRCFDQVSSFVRLSVAINIK